MFKTFLKPFLLSLGYISLVYSIVYLLSTLGITDTPVISSNLMQFDALWYESIADSGYYHARGGGQANSGFYPLLPYLWKVFGLNVWGRCILNAFLFSAAFALIVNLYKPKLITKLLWLSIPSMYFVWVPYSEALFIFLASVLIIGIHKKELYLIWLSLFLLSLTRPIALLLGPALYINELLCYNPSHWYKATIKFFKWYGLPLLIGLGVFILIQYKATGVWFAYFKIQTDGWGHEFNWPTLPLGSMFGDMLLWLNACCLFLALIFLIILVIKGIKWLSGKELNNESLINISLLYFVGIGLETILFNPLWGMNATNIYDVHRYALATPFAWILIYRFVTNRRYDIKAFIGVFLSASLFWFVLFHTITPDRILYYSLATGYILMYMLFATITRKWMSVTVLIINIAVQVTLFQWYLSGEYPG